MLQRVLIYEVYTIVLICKAFTTVQKLSIKECIIKLYNETYLQGYNGTDLLEIFLLTPRATMVQF